jgi:hypothetical protein
VNKDNLPVSSSYGALKFAPEACKLSFNGIAAAVAAAEVQVNLPGAHAGTVFPLCPVTFHRDMKDSQKSAIFGLPETDERAIRKYQDHRLFV